MKQENTTISATIISATNAAAKVEYTVTLKIRKGIYSETEKKFYNSVCLQKGANLRGFEAPEHNWYCYRGFSSLTEAENFKAEIDSELEKIEVEMLRSNASAEAELEYFKSKYAKKNLYIRNAKGQFEKYNN